MKIGFGEYAQVVHSNRDNTMKERTTGAISLLPLGTARGSVKFLSLAQEKSSPEISLQLRLCRNPNPPTHPPTQYKMSIYLL